ncbi:uncharacterized protein LOC119666424 [Teleopsis dalmanni]|uniref:uncharacterized protein LOC119666424 n=1 Tax=Teleopsis dalmanni TaxID=139649 RepID=UPI0018CD0E9C|nr:uncharacterized protein LOC119666424 [Teleopsis dalmanni]
MSLAVISSFNKTYPVNIPVEAISLSKVSVMILAPRRYLFFTNIFIFCFIYILQKFIQLFCIIEEKTCKNSNCTPENRCQERCITSTPPSSLAPVKRFTLVPSTLRKTIRSFGFGEGHFKIFVEEKQRQPSRFNAAIAEMKLNPN